MTAPAVIARLLLARRLLRTHRLQLFLGAVTVICLALAQQLLDHLAIPIHPLRLIVRPFIRSEPQPLHAIEDHLHGIVGGALAIGILNAQNESAAMSPGIKPAEQGGTDAADVQQTGRAGSKARADHEKQADKSKRGATIYSRPC